MVQEALCMMPSTEADLAEAVRTADGPLRVFGGGTRPIGKPVEGTALCTAEMRGIELYEPGALTIVLKAGTPLAEAEATLLAEGQRLPFEPMDHRALLGTEGEPTIGGVVAANVSGPRRVQAGACRDSLIGVRFVDGTGQVIKNGGRVMKNVTGYDLVKLLAGSFGTLGVLTEVAFKVLPVPEAQATLIIDGLEDSQAVRAMSAALGSPFEVSAAAHLTGGTTRLRIEGFASSVAYRAERLRRLLSDFGAVQVEQTPDICAGIWRDVRDVAAFHDCPGDVWRLTVKPSDAPALVARSGIGHAQYDWGGGQVWLLATPGTDLRASLGAFDGHATLMRASPETRSEIAVFQPLPAELAAISDNLRRRFDPHGILNPGLMA